MKPAPPVTRTRRGATALTRPGPASRAPAAPRPRDPPPPGGRPIRPVPPGPRRSPAAPRSRARPWPWRDRGCCGGCRRRGLLPVISGVRSARPMEAACSVATSSTVRRSPEPMLNTLAVPPRGSSRASTKARATSRDVDEVAPLLPVLEHHRPLAVGDARGEDRQHAGVGVRQRLARPVGVPQPQRRALHPVLARSGSASAAPARTCRWRRRRRARAAWSRASARGRAAGPAHRADPSCRRGCARVAHHVLEPAPRPACGRAPRRRSTSRRRPPPARTGRSISCWNSTAVP